MDKKSFEVSEDQIIQAESIVVEEDSLPQPMIVEEQPEVDNVPIEVGAWTNASDFVKYCSAAVRTAPKILATSPTSLTRAIAFYDGLEKEIVDGAAADAERAELSIEQLQTLDNVAEATSMIREQLKVASSRIGMLKTASKAAKFVYVVDPFLFAVARLVINAKVSNGKNIEDTFKRVQEKYAITDRETFALRQIMRDMGYPIHGSLVADDGSYDMITQYFA